MTAEKTPDKKPEKAPDPAPLVPTCTGCKQPMVRCSCKERDLNK